jgi:hypothetical protein
MSYSIKRGKPSKRRTFSTFDDMESVLTTEIKTGKIVHNPSRMQVEAVFYEGKDPEKATPIAIYIVLDGERIAYRGREGKPPYDYPAWIPLKDDVVFHNGIDAPGSDAVQ